jgi:hypothetical protein
MQEGVRLPAYAPLAQHAITARTALTTAERAASASDYGTAEVKSASAKIRVAL